MDFLRQNYKAFAVLGVAFSLLARYAAKKKQVDKARAFLALNIIFLILFILGAFVN